jgi:hypothetical protein
MMSGAFAEDFDVYATLANIVSIALIGAGSS